MQQALQGNIKGEERKEQWPSRRQSGAATSVHPSPSYLQRKTKRNPPLPSPFGGGGVVIYRLSGGRRRGLLIMTLHSLSYPFPSFTFLGLRLQVGISATHTRFPEYGGAKDKKSQASPFFGSGGSVIMSTVCLLPPLPIFSLSDDGDTHAHTLCSQMGCVPKNAARPPIPPSIWGNHPCPIIKGEGEKRGNGRNTQTWLPLTPAPTQPRSRNAKQKISTFLPPPPLRTLKSSPPYLFPLFPPVIVMIKIIRRRLVCCRLYYSKWAGEGKWWVGHQIIPGFPSIPVL